MEMSITSHSEIHATDSLDSILPPSEPHDIRNLFASYVYESPELNTFDGLQDSDGSGEDCLQEEKEGKFGENQPAGNFDKGFLSAENKSLDGFVECTESDGSDYSNTDAMGTGLSESLSFTSEPPDIKNLFSSYVYESPLLDTTDFCTTSDYKEREDGKLCNAGKGCRQDSKDVMDFIDVKDSSRLPSQSRTPDVIVKSTDMVKGTKLECQSVCKDNGNVDLKPVSYIPSHLVSEQVFLGERTQTNSHASVEKKGNKDISGKDYDVKQVSSTDRKGKSSNMINNTFSQDRKSPRKDHAKDSLEKKYLHEMRRSSERKSSGKENAETNILDDGFISMRKKREANACGNITRPVRVHSESITNGLKPLLNPHKDSNANRAVLSDISNSLSHNIVESTGKWCCPQKNKPDHGPPLKQLRLDRWVHRV